MKPHCSCETLRMYFVQKLKATIVFSNSHRLMDVFNYVTNITLSQISTILVIFSLNLSSNIRYISFKSEIEGLPPFTITRNLINLYYQQFTEVLK